MPIVREVLIPQTEYQEYRRLKEANGKPPATSAHLEDRTQAAKPAHNPMEWAYDEDDARIYYDDGNVQPTIAYVEREGVAPEQVKADGYLLAAAPELLEALTTLLPLAQEMRELMEEWPDVNYNIANAPFNKALTAIAKATGGPA